MSERIHRDFQAYCPRVPVLEKAQLFSLKLERADIANVRRLYVDALLLSGKHIIPVPFILVTNDGAAVLHEHHRALHAEVRKWLQKTVTVWVATKKPDANLVADVFEKDASTRDEILNAANDPNRAFPALAPYAALFNEAERYANLSPFVLGRSVQDHNPGFGYGVRTLAAAASAVSAPSQVFADLTRRLRPRLREASGRADVSVWLDAPREHVAEIVDRLRAATSPSGVAIVSQRGDDAAAELRSAGAEVLQMSRPGCNGLGVLDEWLGIFRNHARKYIDVSLPAGPAATGVSASKRPLRVLFALRPSAQSVFGGDVVQVRETAEALRRRGHFVEISMALSLDASGFDIVHLTNITVPPETLPQAQSVAGFSGAVVLMPIFTDHSDEAVWGMNVTPAVYASHEGLEDLEAKLRTIEARALSVGSIMPPPQRSDIIEGYTGSQKATLDLVDFVIANADSEMHRLYRYLSCDVPYAVVPSCANPLVYGAHARDRFVARFGFEDFVLLAGRYEARKNQLNFFHAMADFGLPLLFIGNNYDASFGTLVRMHRPGNAAYIGHLAEEDLAGAFAAARIVAVPSWDEVVSLTSLNAAISGASMVLTRNSYEHEYFRDDAEYCDPGSVGSIASAVLRAWQTHDARAERRAHLVSRVASEYNWDKCAERTEQSYYRVLACNPRGDGRRARASAATSNGVR